MNTTKTASLQPVLTIDAEHAFWALVRRHGGSTPTAADLQSASRYARRRIRRLCTWRNLIRSGGHFAADIDAEMSDWEQRRSWCERKWRDACGIHR